ncbi:MAG: sigma-70 family RNA polymerase sigma factor, partial [Actinomycetota bacterium]
MRPGQDYDLFFREGYEAAFRLARRIVAETAEAEDVAAEAFARAYRDWARVGPLPYRQAWVLRVAANVAIDRVRHEERQARITPLPRSVVAASGEDEVAVRQALVAALRALPQRQRETVALRYLGDLTLEEVAAALGMATGTVKSHLHRGVASLRRTIGAGWYGGVA